MIPIIFGTWFTAKNSSGQFIGNKFAKIRLSGNDVKPTGLPSPLNTDVNLNLVPAIYNILDEKNDGIVFNINVVTLGHIARFLVSTNIKSDNKGI